MKMLHERIEDWGLRLMLESYVDDGALTQMGETSALAWLLPWAYRLMLRWVRHVLCKEIAPEKAHCITSTRQLKNIFERELQNEGVAVSLDGEFLGIGFSAGRPLRARRAAAARRRKTMGRLVKVLWLKRKGGRKQAEGCGSRRTQSCSLLWCPCARHHRRLSVRGAAGASSHESRDVRWVVNHRPPRAGRRRFFRCGPWSGGRESAAKGSHITCMGLSSSQARTRDAMAAGPG